jgi:hypothetical protein
MLLERLACEKGLLVDREIVTQHVDQPEEAREVIRRAKGGDPYVLLDRIAAEEERQTVIASKTDAGAVEGRFVGVAGPDALSPSIFVRIIGEHPVVIAIDDDFLNWNAKPARHRGVPSFM